MTLKSDNFFTSGSSENVSSPAREDLKRAERQVAFALFHPQTRHQRSRLRLRLVHRRNPMVLLSGRSCKLLRVLGESQMEIAGR